IGASAASSPPWALCSPAPASGRSLDERSPLAMAEAVVPITDPDPDPEDVRRTEVLGGLIHEYRLVA
ncbi:MAG TPA: hypothetical protein VNG12_16120, partial [Acidimicrobiales bacterium]|nr:hypothetical protein [Acidimicrobiales bacterium]